MARPGQPTDRTAGNPSRQRCEADLQLDLIVPVIMGCALLWWVGREMSLTARLTMAAATVALILAVLMFEQSR
jgi:hypothetical protein